MECALKMAPSSIRSLMPQISPSNSNNWRGFPGLNHGNCWNNALSSSPSRFRAITCAVGDVHKQRSSLESLFCYDKPIPEEIIEDPIGISISEKNIGSNPRCTSCEAKGAILCATCSGSGLYVDSILESQGIIVKVRCVGCGGTGNTMCSECGAFSAAASSLLEF